MSIMKIILFLICIPILASGQNKILDVPPNEGSHWTDVYLPGSLKDLQLRDLQRTIDLMHLRIIDDRRAIEIWTNDFQTFYGCVTNFVMHSSPSVLYHSEIPLDTASAQIAYTIFKKDSLLQVISRTKQNNPDWGLVDDGTPIVIEYATPTIYMRGSYWAPGVFKKIKDAVIIDQVVENIYHELDLDKKWEEFANTLPIGWYTIDGYISMEVISPPTH